jgi:hypothetical protein
VDAWRRTHSAELEAIVEQAAAHPHVERLPPRHNPDSFRVRIRELPARTVAYIRVDRPYQGDNAMKAVWRLLAWAERNGVADGQWLGYQWDNPEITSLEECRYYVAVEAERVTPRGEVGRNRFPPLAVAEVAIRGPAQLRGVDGSAVRPRDGVLRAGRSTADPTGVRSRAVDVRLPF